MFSDDLKSRPISFYLTIAFSGLLAYGIIKKSTTPLNISLATISSSLIQQYAFQELKSDPSTPDEISAEVVIESSPLDNYF